MKKSIIIICLLSFLFTPLIYAYQFEDYVWGTPKDKVLAQLKEKGKNIVSISNDLTEINYSDKILDKPCTVGLVFTPKTQLLASIGIAWEDTNIGEDLKILLTKKYGEPTQRQHNESNQPVEEFIWGDILEKDFIGLTNFFFETTFKDGTTQLIKYTSLGYCGGKYRKMYEKEHEEELLLSKDRNKF